MPVEFDCEGCAIHVFAYGVDRPPSHRLCATCAWLCEYVHDPVEFWILYCRMREQRA